MLATERDKELVAFHNARGRCLDLPQRGGDLLPAELQADGGEDAVLRVDVGFDFLVPELNLQRGRQERGWSLRRALAVRRCLFERDRKDEGGSIFPTAART